MTLLIELAVKSTVVSGAALALLAVLKGRSAAERSWVAHAALAVLAILPVAVVLLPRWRVMPPTETLPAATILGATPLAAPLAAPAVDPGLWLQTLYLGGAALLLFATLVAVCRLVVLRRGATALADPHWLAALTRAQARMKVRARAALLVSTAVTSPVSWGLIKPTIVVNDGLVASKDDAEAVIAHELAHVARLDWAKLIGARLVTALFWFNPLVWVLADQCHQLREEAADDAVLAAEVSSADYASLLVEAARHHGRRGLIAAHGVAPSRGSLHRRVTRVLDAAARRTPTPAAWALAVVAGAALFAGPLAALTLEPAEAAPTAPAAVTVTGSAPANAPALTTAKSAPAAKSARRAVVTVTSASRGKIAASSVRTLAGPGEPAAATTTGVRPGKGQLTLASAPAAPNLVLHKPAAPRVTVAAAAPAAPKVAVHAASSKTAVPPRPKVTIAGMANTTASSNVSHSMTINGKTVRVETVRENDDRADQRADQRDRLRDQAEWRADEAQWRKDQVDVRDARREEQEVRAAEQELRQAQMEVEAAQRRVAAASARLKERAAVTP